VTTKTVQNKPLSVRVNVTWTSDARRVPLEVPDEPATIKAARANVQSAVRKAVKACLQHAPIKQPALRGLMAASTSPSKIEVDVTFVTDDEIAELNTNYRQKNRPTDVLSFSQYEGTAWSCDGAAGGPLMLGDIIISIETMQRQAAQQKHDLAAEAAFLTVHGTLHLCGYDHNNASARRIMWKWQEEVIEMVR
jgi:probable rRNA maturation factor